MNPNAPPIVGNVARVTVRSVCNAQTCLNTFDYFYASVFSVDANDLSNLAGAWDTAFGALYKNILSPLSKYTDITVQELQFGTAPTVTVIPAGAGFGAAGATNLPLEMAAVASRYGNWKGKHGRGRVSFPAVPNTFITPATDANVINAAGLTAYNNLLTPLLATLSVGFLSWVPYITTRPVPPLSTVTRGVEIVSYTMREILGTARRRKPGRGI